MEGHSNDSSGWGASVDGRWRRDGKASWWRWSGDDAAVSEWRIYVAKLREGKKRKLEKEKEKEKENQFFLMISKIVHGSTEQPAFAISSQIDQMDYIGKFFKDLWLNWPN